ncbi:DNA primase [Streptomyces sp. WAC 05379]|uniref:DNA primase n=1 Tax=Streptomyces sp. WAC 05379 TaxID=2203207 RepID=UPI000F736F16|nr:DNA primase [Streptomyces sp. WAC 05379]RSN76721.1 DNA primase [Streptomyces sp. WAC 05379]
MNRVGLGLAVGAGYVLGRTKKMKLAFALGTLVAGKRLNLTPQGIMDLVSGQLKNNPQFKEIGDQLREDLRGVGQAASGAMVERQLDAFADRLHGRTAEVREQLTGAVPTPDLGAKDEDGEDGEDRDDEPEESAQDSTDDEERERPARKATAKKPAAKKTATKAAKKAPAKQSAPKKKTAAKRTGGAARSAARQTAGARHSKGGDGS